MHPTPETPPQPLQPRDRNQALDHLVSPRIILKTPLLLSRLTTSTRFAISRQPLHLFQTSPKLSGNLSPPHPVIPSPSHPRPHATRSAPCPPPPPSPPPRHPAPIPHPCSSAAISTVPRRPLLGVLGVFVSW
jgi:hypothetical protein